MRSASNDRHLGRIRWRAASLAFALALLPGRARAEERRADGPELSLYAQGGAIWRPSQFVLPQASLGGLLTFRASPRVLLGVQLPLAFVYSRFQGVTAPPVMTVDRDSYHFDLSPQAVGAFRVGSVDLFAQAGGGLSVTWWNPPSSTDPHTPFFRLTLRAGAGFRLALWDRLSLIVHAAAFTYGVPLSNDAPPEWWHLSHQAGLAFRL